MYTPFKFVAERSEAIIVLTYLVRCLHAFFVICQDIRNKTPLPILKRVFYWILFFFGPEKTKTLGHNKDILLIQAKIPAPS